MGWDLLMAASLFLTGVATGLGLTWWRWKMALELESRATEWKAQVGSQIRYIEKMDESLGNLTAYLKAHIRMTTPEGLRSAVARLVGEEAPAAPRAGWDTPIPPFEPGGVGKTERSTSAPGRTASARPA